MESSTGTILAGVGTAGVIIGSMTPWATVTTALGTLSVSGTEGDGKITLSLGIALGVFVLMAASAKAEREYTVAVIGFAAVAAAVSIYDLQDVARAAGDTPGAFTQPGVGWGLYVCAAGAVVAVAGGIVRFGELRPARGRRDRW